MQPQASRRRFSYLELLRATDGFSANNLIGRGSFGSVYKARLQDGMEFAIKVFHFSCSNEDFRALVLEYTTNGSLEKVLYLSNCILDILQRLNIMIDVTSALEYLHFGYSTPIIHCDLKPHNKLLDDNIVAHLSDFGIAKLLTGEDQSMTQTQTLAIIGYMAPAGSRECRPTTVTLQLADRSHAYPEGKIEDVLVKVDKFIFPVDFIVLDFEADKEVPIILGRPFLATGKTLIDVQKGELTMRVNDQQVTFNVLEAMKNPDEVEDCNFLSVVDFVVADRIDRCCSNEINKVTTFEDLEEEDVAANQIDWMEEKQSDRHNKFIEHLNLSDKEVKTTLPSIESPPSLELKLLPSHLKYVYLGQNNTLPVIISSTLNAGQEQSLVDLLGRYRRAIGWTIAYIKGISPSIYMHKILLDDCYSNSMEQQRRLNPIMKEVVKKEIIKWLDAEIIYPISDNSWVSQVQCVPKKGGITVIANERDELIPTRTVTG
ncbi:hypothetical protein WN944_026165 [Citrus x changshan-huyou]|uniref:Protein kinase domain-containing protein n=1 Tax=Citrus x changshan-huyou TaxID=2935761 RepID=A0AAP0LRJ2_9ROSI